MENSEEISSFVREYIRTAVQEKIWNGSPITNAQILTQDFILFSIVCIIALFSYFVVKFIVIGLVRKAVRSTKNSWDNEVLNGRLFTWLSLIAPTVVVLKGAHWAFSNTDYQDFVVKFSEVMLILLGFLAVNSILNLSERIYRRYDFSKKFPIKGFIQVIKIIITICCSIFIISALIGKSPLSLFAGLGAMSAVLMFIFKDSILGLVAGVQLSANQMVARGDWIEVPKFGANGEVLEVALTTVKVRNWDKTITTLPTYALISDSFKNWRGMSNSKVRRIKRSVLVDIQSVKFVDTKLQEKLKSIDLLKDYFIEKEEEFKQNAPDSNKELGESRLITNVGAYRAYMHAYLNKHSKISLDETVMVRQLQSTHYGLPLEVYVFCNDNRWVFYEGIQSDIFDHYLAIISEFDLQVYQRPGGHDIIQ